MKPTGEENQAKICLYNSPPGGAFIEQVAAIPVNALPAGVSTYLKQHYKGAKITEAGKVTDAKDTINYEAEVKGKDLLFDEKGNFLKLD